MDGVARKPRWYRLTPGRLIVSLLLAEGLLWLSERLDWPTWQKNDCVLLCSGLVVAAMAVLLLSWLAAPIFRLRLQFTIRMLLALVLAVALPCSWFAVAMKQAREQDAAVAALRATGAAVEGNWAPYNSASASTTADEVAAYNTARGRARQLLAAVFGEALFCDVRRVVSFAPNPGGMGGFGGISFGRALNDSDLACLRKFHQLEELSLWHSAVTDAGMSELRRLRELRTLDLSGTKITDAGMSELRGLRQLRTLRFSETRITDAGLESLRGSENIEFLDLSGLMICDAGVATIARLKQLKTLDLQGTNVTDAGIGLLTELPNLEYLCIDSTCVGNAGLQRLAGLSRLRHLSARDTNVDESGAKWLRATLPTNGFEYSTRLSATDRKAIRSALRADPPVQEFTIVRIKSVPGGGADVRLAGGHSDFGARVQMEKSDGTWRVIFKVPWYGESGPPNGGQSDDPTQDK